MQRFRIYLDSFGVSFDPNLSLHHLAIFSTCLLFDFYSDFCRLHLIFLNELRYPVISPSNFVFLIRDMIFVSECIIQTHRVSFDSASLPLEGKLIPQCASHPWFSETKVVGDINNQLTHQDAFDLFPTLVCLTFVPCRHASPAITR